MWGANPYGQLGDGTTTDKEVPTEITSNFSLSTGEKIISLSLGSNHASALTSTGRVFMWGGNGSGQLGDGTTTDKNVPTEITSNISLRPNDKIIGLSLGKGYSSALSAMGRVFVWGWNELGYLGDGTSTSRSIPTEITTGFSLFVGETIISLSKGSTHASALTSTGRVFMWGDNQYGYLGDGTSITRNVPTEITSNFSLSTGEKIISLSLGSTHSSALTSTGRVFMWGWNEFGQLGNGMNVNRNLPTEITSNFSLATGEKVMSLSLGYTHSSALTSTGRVFMWGGNGSGQLGDGTTTDKNVPTEITSNFSLRPNDKIIGLSLGGVYSSALSAMGRVFVWGWNELGYLGDGTSTSRSIPTEITTGFSLS
jgi:alpha-tubulin suppressor-like RCC1 family protein